MTNMKIADTINPRTIVKLFAYDDMADVPGQGAEVELIVRMPMNAFAPAWNCLHGVMNDGAPHLESWLVEEGRSENELRLLCGLFWHIADNLPMDTKHFLDWQAQVGLPQYLDEFASRRVVSMKASAAN